MKSFLEANARERITALLDPGSFVEFLPPEKRNISPHLIQLDLPVSFDDGIVVGKGKLNGKAIFIASQEGGFLGGSVGEVHGAKLTGLLRLALQEKINAVILSLDTGGVRLHEANAGLIAVSEVMRALLDVRNAGMPVIVLIGGPNGCYGGMGIVACCANRIVMSEESRMGMSGPEVIETAFGVEEFDSQDRALIWRTMGGKHRYLLGDCHTIVPDQISAFRQAAIESLKEGTPLTFEKLEEEQLFLQQRLQSFGSAADSRDIWEKIGVTDTEAIPLQSIEEFTAAASKLSLKESC
jgi:malonate decarboxylase beta subunit